VGITAGSREVPGRKSLSKEMIIIIILDLFAETEGFLTAIKNLVILRRN